MTFITIRLAQPLVVGEKIYITDGCTDPNLSVPVAVSARVPAPALTTPAVALLAGLLGLAGLSRLRRNT